MERRRNRPSPAATLVVALVLVLAIASAASGAVLVRGLRTDTGRNVWSPKTRSIVPGTTIRWRAVEGSHNVKSRGANWSYFRNLPNGSAVTRTFNRRGTFRYLCTIHGDVTNGVCSGMCGRIVVS